MTAEQALKQEARECASWRGHFLGKFKRDPFWVTVATAYCQKCNMSISVELFKGYEITGEAVALNCTE